MSVTGKVKVKTALAEPRMQTQGKSRPSIPSGKARWFCKNITTGLAMWGHNSSILVISRAVCLTLKSRRGLTTATYWFLPRFLCLSVPHNSQTHLANSTTYSGLVPPTLISNQDLRDMFSGHSDRSISSVSVPSSPAVDTHVQSSHGLISICFKGGFQARRSKKGSTRYLD